MPQNLVEKIAQKFAVNFPVEREIHSGDYISVKPAYVMTHDNTGAVIPKFMSIGASKIAYPRQVVHTLDHNIQDKSDKNLEKYRKIESFSRKMGVDFYPAGRGIGHQIMCEEGYAWPGTFVVASDSHSNMYGGLGCLGTPIVRTDAAAIWATGQTWWQVPPVARVTLSGKLIPGVTGKDVIIALCGFFNQDEVLNHAIEFTGEGLEILDINSRLTIANMTTEWGALAGIFPVDQTTITWLYEREKYIRKRGLAGVPSDADGKGGHPRINTDRIRALENDPLSADPDAFYAKELALDISSVQPYISGPNSVKVMTPVAEIDRKNIRVNKAYLVSCVNSRLDDIHEAAEILRGKKIADGVSFYVAAASSEVQHESELQGDWQALVEAGAEPLPPGCGPCIGLGTGLLEDGDVGISATNRNFKGRMGSRNADAYLASPAVVAASALAGRITFPGNWKTGPVRGDLRINKKPYTGTTDTEIIPGFDPEISGELIFCDQDNMNTDGIYPGKYTYIDDFTPEQQAAVVMENYDPGFQKLVRKGDILVGGFNFGTGSSREQAATALKYRGIQVVIAGSFSETYKRNALNNGFLIIELPELILYLRELFAKTKPTLRTGLIAEINYKRSELKVGDRIFKTDPVGEAAQELVVVGGLEALVAGQIKEKNQPA
jgi:homoaconitate hydratase